MDQRTPSRLGMVMDALNISGKELAAALHVDHSLVSKWRNNRRQLLPHSTHAEQVAGVLWDVQENHDHNVLNPILRAYNPEADLSDMQQARDVLRAWLTDRTPSAHRPIWNNDESGGQSWYDAHFRVWHDDVGRRAAVIDFLETVLEMRAPQRLLLVSQEDMEWIVGDPEFLQRWRHLLQKVLQAGHHIEMIHWVDRDPNTIQPILESWLPLHLTGQISSWFYPKYVDLAYRLTLFLIQDRVALVGIQPDGASPSRHTALYSDPITQRQYEAIFEQLRADCQPLVRVQPASAIEEVLYELETRRTRRNTSFWVAPLPPVMTYSDELFGDILEANQLPPDVEQRLLEHKRRFDGRSVQCLIALSALTKALAKPSLVHFELSAIAGQPVVLQREHVVRHINELCDEIRNSDNLRFAFADTLFEANPISLWIEQHHAVLAWSEHPQLGHSATAEEPTIVSAFFHRYEELWDSIPRVQRDPGRMAGQLEALLTE